MSRGGYLLCLCFGVVGAILVISTLSDLILGFVPNSTRTMGTYAVFTSALAAAFLLPVGVGLWGRMARRHRWPGWALLPAVFALLGPLAFAALWQEIGTSTGPQVDPPAQREDEGLTQFEIGPVDGAVSPLALFYAELVWRVSTLLALLAVLLLSIEALRPDRRNPPAEEVFE